MRRKPTPQPSRCVCEPGPNAAKEHAKPGKKVADHLNPKCVHSELRHTTRKAPKVKTVKRLRLQ
jgi:hypothetical protein